MLKKKEEAVDTKQFVLIIWPYLFHIDRQRSLAHTDIQMYRHPVVYIHRHENRACLHRQLHIKEKESIQDGQSTVIHILYVMHTYKLDSDFL